MKNLKLNFQAALLQAIFKLLKRYYPDIANTVLINSLLRTLSIDEKIKRLDKSALSYPPDNQEFIIGYHHKLNEIIHEKELFLELQKQQSVIVSLLSY